MKILITSDLWKVKTNGVVTSVRNLVNELRAKGHDARILTLAEIHHSYKNEYIYQIKSFSLEVIYPSVRGSLAIHDGLIKELIDWCPDVIHSQCEFFTFHYAKYISKHTGAPIIHTYHTMYEDYVNYVMPSKLIGKLIVRIFSKHQLSCVDTVIAPSSKTMNVLNRYGIRDNVMIIPTGISLEQHNFCCSEMEKSELRRRYGISEDDFVLLSLGRLGSEKNTDELIKNATQFLRTDNKFVLLIVGDGPARKSLEKLCEELQIDDKVIFTGFVSPEDVQKYYQIADVFVSASTSETQGLVFIEAAANGLPLICKKDPCLDDLISQGENGFEFVTCEDFRRAVTSFREHPDYKMYASRISRSKASRFDNHHFADAVESVYLKAAGGLH